MSFDRDMAMIELGKKVERDRIVKLLEAWKPVMNAKSQVYFAPFNVLVAIIKGENK